MRYRIVRVEIDPYSVAQIRCDPFQPLARLVSVVIFGGSKNQSWCNLLEC